MMLLQSAGFKRIFIWHVNERTKIIL